MRFQSDFMRTLDERGYIHQASDAEALDGAAASGRLTGYIGFDMTAPSLHVGSLVQIMMLRRMQQTGHRPIVLLGGATTKVGDPSDKDKQRPLLTDEEIDRNRASLKRVFSKLLAFEGENAALMVDNSEWLERLGYIEFLRRYGPHFTINRMLTFESVKRRLDREQPLTLLEFNYMLMQAVDFLELNGRIGCRLQMGGSDQWGNIINGVELCRRVAGADVFGLTTPLLTTSSGAKMGKTAQGAVWLSEDLLSPYEYWQFWRNAEDADVGRFLRLFTDLPLSKIARLEALQGAEINEAKRILATEATALLHGRDAAERAQASAAAAFAGAIGADVPTMEVARDELEGLRVAAALTKAGLTASNGEAKRHLKAGAVQVNGAVVTDELAALGLTDLDASGLVRLTLGKKRHANLRAV